MPTLTNNLDCGTEDATITSGNSGGDCGDAFDTVAIDGTNALTFDNEHTHLSSTRAAKFVNDASAANCFMSWRASLGSVTSMFGRLYLWRGSGPADAVTQNIIKIRQDAGPRRAEVQLRGSGANVIIRVTDDTGAVILTGTTNIPTGQWVRIEWNWEAESGPTASDGTMEVRLFLSAESTTADETLTDNAADVGDTANRIQIGMAFSESATYWLDDIEVNDTGYPGPFVAYTGPQFGASATPVINNTVGTSTVFNSGLPTRNENDLLHVSIARAVVTAAITFPSGFRLNKNINHDGGDLAAFTKVITASEPSTYTFSWTGNSRNVGQMWTTVNNPDPTNTLAAEPTGATGSDTTPDPPASGAVASGDYLAIAIGGQEGKGATRITAGTPSGYTLREDDGNSGGGAGTTHDSSFVSTQELTGITAEDPGTFTSSVNDGWGTLTFLVAGAAAVYPPFPRPRLPHVRM